ncbi:MAG: hypothetical protein WDM96_14095 [Lacunisphaera sp.]
MGLEGHEFTFDGSRWARCSSPEGFADYLEAEGDRRSTFIDETQRRGVAVKMKRKAGTPIEVLTTTFPPWLSEWVATELRAGRDPRTQLAKIRSAWMGKVFERLQGERFLLGYAFHADTDDLHFDVCVSRQDGKGGRVGDAGLGLVGPWCVGVDRQLRAGAEIAPIKRSQLLRSVANFRHREGADAVPVDVQFARDLDGAADEVIGPALSFFKTAYGKQVPLLEQQHAQAELDVLDAARGRITAAMPATSRQRPPPPPSHEIEM